jgi:hypothetical protein
MIMRRAKAFTLWYRREGKEPISKNLSKRWRSYPREETMDITEADIIRMKESLTGIQDPWREWGEPTAQTHRYTGHYPNYHHHRGT